MTGTEFVRERKPEGWNRPPIIEPDGEGELLEVAMGRTIPRRTASSAWTWPSTASASSASNPSSVTCTAIMRSWPRA